MAQTTIPTVLIDHPRLGRVLVNEADAAAYLAAAPAETPAEATNGTGGGSTPDASAPASDKPVKGRKKADADAAAGAE